MQQYQWNKDRDVLGEEYTPRKLTDVDMAALHQLNEWAKAMHHWGQQVTAAIDVIKGLKTPNELSRGAITEQLEIWNAKGHLFPYDKSTVAGGISANHVVGHPPPPPFQ